MPPSLFLSKFSSFLFPYMSKFSLKTFESDYNKRVMHESLAVAFPQIISNHFGNISLVFSIYYMEIVAFVNAADFDY